MTTHVANGGLPDGRSRLEFLIVLAMGILFSLVARGDQSVSLTWNASTGTNIAGYYLYYGAASTNYTNRIDVGNNTTVTVTGLTGRSVNYYFSAKAYDQNRVESPPSNLATFQTSSNSGPTLAAIPSQTANVKSLLVLTNAASGSSLQQQLTYSLDPGAPADMRIHPQSGRVVWVPKLNYGGTTNQFTVRVTDNSAQALYDTQTFSVVVSNAVEVTLGTNVVALGQTGIVPVTVASSAQITNLTFVLDAPSNRVGNVTVQSLVPGSIIVSQQSAGALHSTVTIRLASGQVFQGTQALAQISFTATPNRPSLLGALTASSVTAIQANGLPVPRGFGSDGEIVLIGAESVMKAVTQTNGQRDLVLFGPAGQSFQVQSSSSPLASGLWAPIMTSDAMTTNMTQVFTGISSNSTSRFYRALKL